MAKDKPAEVAPELSEEDQRAAQVAATEAGRGGVTIDPPQPVKSEDEGD